ncbi:MAG: SRPBCC family protein [Alphaproteobacteria bacterium]|nr:SRPBCC family protein [Alphaproteobacteria bacterium]
MVATGASIQKEVVVDASPADVWDAMRDYGAVHKRLARGFVIDCRLDGDARIVTFANGSVAREVLVSMDDQTRRLVYTIVGTRLKHHNASFQVFAEGDNRTRITWIADILPNDLAPYISSQMEEGTRVMKQTLESHDR